MVLGFWSFRGVLGCFEICGGFGVFGCFWVFLGLQLRYWGIWGRFGDFEVNLAPICVIAGFLAFLGFGWFSGCGGLGFCCFGGLRVFLRVDTGLGFSGCGVG